MEATDRRGMSRAEPLGSAVRSPTASGTVTPLPGAGPQHNLPVALTSFVGRERELRELRGELENTRLLTLTGAGGCGKTRLALRVAGEVLDRFPGGVWWVELAPLAEERLVGAAIAEAVGVRPLPGVSELQAACAYLAPRRALVVLDNCEHMLDTCAEAVQVLLEAGLELIIMATSRAPLGIGGETEWRVPSLSLGGVEVNGSGADVARSDAVSLFVERARQARQDFSASQENVGSVAKICADLDGLPLAIELAAARLRILSVEQIASEVADRFRLLTGGPRTALERHQTLRASVDWSHDLLSAPERALLRRLAVFGGGFTLEAAEQVCTGDGVEPKQALDLLASLVDQSLVIAEERDSAVRYRLLEMVRQYGLERLVEAGEEEALRARHRDAFLALAERLEPELTGAGQPEALDLLDANAPNIHRALEWAATTDPEKALRLCSALTFWWVARGLFAAGDGAFDRALAAAGEEPAELRARVLWGRGHLMMYAGHYEEAAASASQALELAEEVGDHGTAARGLEVLGRLRFMADPPGCFDGVERSRRLAHAAGDAWCEADMSQVMAYAQIAQEEYESGLRELDAAAEINEHIGYRPFDAWHCFGHGWARYPTGEHELCRELLGRAISAAREVSEPVSEGLAVSFLAMTETDRGEASAGLEPAEACLERMVTAGAGMAIPFVEEAIAHAKLAQGRLDEARANAVAAAETPGFIYVTGWALATLAEIERLRGDANAADERAEAALTIADQAGSGWVAARARHVSARLAAKRGEWDVAGRLLHQAVDARAEGGFRLDMPDSLEALAELAAGRGRDEDATRLLAAAVRARRDLGFVRVLPEHSHWEALARRLQGTLGDQGYSDAWADGDALALEEAVAWVRRARGSRGRPESGWGSLTPTEVKVAALVAEGHTNPQIGERMFISPATVKTHLAHIFRKLGVHSRGELTAQAVRRDAQSTPTR